MDKWADMFKEFGESIKEVADICETVDKDKFQLFTPNSMFKSNIWKDPETARIMRVYTPSQWNSLSAQEKKDYQDEQPKRLAIIREKQAEELISRKIQGALDKFKQ
jgi:hypothetical protein